MTENIKETVKAINIFRNEISAKRDEMKSVSYKTVQHFFKEMNELLEYEYFKFEIVKGVYHSYNVVDRLRCNDSYKDGYFIKISIGNEKYDYHTKEQNAAWNMNLFVKTALSKGGAEIFAEVRELKKQPI